MKADRHFPAGQRMRSGDSLLEHTRCNRWCRSWRRPARPQGRCVRRNPNSPIQKRSRSKTTMHWVVSCISNLANGESEVAPKSRRLQMMARVQLDASNVSRCVTARREKVPRYIRVLNELLRYTHVQIVFFTLASSWVYWERTGSRFLERVLKFHS